MPYKDPRVKHERRRWREAQKRGSEIPRRTPVAFGGINRPYVNPNDIPDAHAYERRVMRVCR